MKIIFMGSPEFAAIPLNYLIEQGIEISAVFTQTPKKRDRGMKELFTPVHARALEQNILVYTPQTLKSDAAYQLIESISADIIVVVAYGFILPQRILDSKKYGCINLHPSLLPKYRGAAPMQHTIINGEKETGVCVIQMDAGLDTGEILLQQNFPINNVTLTELHDQCAKIGGDLLLKVLTKYEQLTAIPQDNYGSSYASKFTKLDGLINWQETAVQIECKIRGMNPWPGTYFEYQGKMLKILHSDYSLENQNFEPGFIMNKDFHIACGQGYLIPKIVKQEGKKAMTIEEFLRGLN